MSPSQDGTLPEFVIPQKYNSPLTLYIFLDFHILKCFLDINSLVDQIKS